MGCVATPDGEQPTDTDKVVRKSLLFSDLDDEITRLLQKHNVKTTGKNLLIVEKAIERLIDQLEWRNA